MSDDERERLWLQAWCEGDRKAGDLLTMEYFTRIRSYFRQRAPDEYEELVNETFKVLAEVRCKFRAESSVRSFLFGIARKVFLRYLKALSRQREIDTFRSSMHELLGRRFSSLYAAHQALLEALTKLPVAQHEMLELYYWHELTGPELSATFEISESAVHGHLHRARERLRELLDIPSNEELLAMLAKAKKHEP